MENITHSEEYIRDTIKTNFGMALQMLDLNPEFSQFSDVYEKILVKNLENISDFLQNLNHEGKHIFQLQIDDLKNTQAQDEMIYEFFVYFFSQCLSKTICDLNNLENIENIEKYENCESYIQNIDGKNDIFCFEISFKKQTQKNIFLA